jgi:ATP-dependent Zn protease
MSRYFDFKLPWDLDVIKYYPSHLCDYFCFLYDNGLIYLQKELEDSTNDEGEHGQYMVLVFPYVLSPVCGINTVPMQIALWRQIGDEAYLEYANFANKEAGERVYEWKANMKQSPYADCEKNSCPKTSVFCSVHIMFTLAYGLKTAPETVKQYRKWHNDHLQESDEHNSFHLSVNYLWNPKNGLEYASQKDIIEAVKLARSGEVFLSNVTDDKGLSSVKTLLPGYVPSLYPTTNVFPYADLRVGLNYFNPSSNLDEIYSVTEAERESSESGHRFYLLYLAGYIQFLHIRGSYFHQLEIRDKLLNEYREKINSNIDFVKSCLEDPDDLEEELRRASLTKRLYFAIKAERGCGQHSVCEYIAYRLWDQGLLYTPEYKQITLYDLSRSDVTYTEGGDLKYRNLRTDHLYVITGLREFLNLNGKNDSESQRINDYTLKLLSKLSENRYVIIMGDNKDVTEFLNLHENFQRIYHNVALKQWDNERIIRSIESQVPYPLDDAVKTHLAKWLPTARDIEPLKNEELARYVASQYVLSKDVKLRDYSINKDKLFKDLDRLVGLSKIKQQIKALDKYLLFRSELQQNSKPVPPINLHMLFLGNPGTGKTTVARIIGRLFYSIGLLKKDTFIECSAKDLIGEYVGQTAPKTQKMIDRAMGGVLFIDEAYSLTVGKKNSSGAQYGQECIATLIKAMEDHKGEFVVIFAGYTQEMHDFVATNPGISSRIGYTFEFPDYSEEELYEIFKIKMENFTIDNKAEKQVRLLLTYFHSVKNVGNGRLVDNVIQRIYIKHAENRKGGKLLELTIDSIPTVAEMSESLYSDGEVKILPENITEDDLHGTAVHELGHAIISFLETSDSNIEKITIIPEATGTLGYVRYKDNDAIIHYDIQAMRKHISRLFGGRAAEEAFFGPEHISNGCSSDIKKATDIATVSMTAGGWSETYGLIYTDEPTMIQKAAFEKELKVVLDDIYKETLEKIEKYKDVIEAMSKVLIKEKSMDGVALNKLFKKELGKG